MLKNFALVLVLSLLTLTTIYAQQPEKKKEPEYTRSNARMNFFPLFLGRLSGNYEYQNNKNSLNVNGNWGFAGRRRGFLVGSNFRHYFHPKRTSFFFGAISNFSDYSENATFLDEQEQEVKTQIRGHALLIAPNAGLRIRILRLINITTRFGYANPFVLRYTSERIDMPETDLSQYRRSFRLRSAFDGEFSFGIHF
jgi:hypothetical protein